MRLSANDPAILRALLGWSYGEFPQGSLGVTAQSIAEGTGLHRNTVARRIAALQQNGVIEGYLLEPHPATVGSVRAGHRFDGVEATDAQSMAAVLADFPWVSVAALHMDSCFLHTWHPSKDQVKEQIDALSQALGASGVIFSFRSDLWPPGPADDLALSDLDRRILVALRRGAKRSVGQIAGDAGTTRRTAARHLERLAKAGAGAMLPLFRPSRIEGHLIAIFDGPANRQASGAVREVFPDRIMGPVMAGPRVMAMVPVRSADEAARLLARANRVPGLEALEMQFLRDMLFPEACDAWLAERVQNAPRPVTNL